MEQLTPGRWALAVSGGADSVALLHLAIRQPQLQVVAVHLDHQTRQGASTEDAHFVRDLCARLGVELELAQRDQLEREDHPANTQARYRMMRLALFARVVKERGLQGVLQGHHADDQAETILMRLLRGTGIEGLRGIPGDACIGGLRVRRPLLGIRREELRKWLEVRGLAWREDASNGSTQYLRNRVRQFLRGRDALVERLLWLQRCFEQLGANLDAAGADLPESFSVKELIGRPRLVQLHALRAWAMARHAAADDLTLTLLERLRLMVEDMSTGPAMCLPGGIEVRRTAGMIRARESRGSDRRRCGWGPAGPCADTR